MIVAGYRIEEGRVLDADKTNPINCIHGRRLEVDSRHAPAVLCYMCEYEVAKLTGSVNSDGLGPPVTDTDPL